MNRRAKLPCVDGCYEQIEKVKNLDLDGVSLDVRREIWTALGSFKAMCWLYEDLWAHHYPNSIYTVKEETND